MYLLATAIASAHGINAGNIIFQLVMFFFMLAIPLAIILYLVLRKRNNRLKSIEEKIDKLLSKND